MGQIEHEYMDPDNGMMEISVKEFADNSLDIILAVDRSGRIRFANQKAVETYGYSYNELLSLSIFDLRKQDTRTFTENQLNEALKRGIQFRTYHYRKDGSKLLVDVKSIYSNRKDKDVAISIVRDITDMERICKDAHMFSISLDILDDAFVVFNGKRNILNWSKGAEKKFGFTKEEIIGENINVIIPENKLKEPEMLLDKIKGGIIIKDFETVRVNRLGEEISVSISASPIYEADGLFSGYIAIYKDISDRILIEYELKNKCKQLELLKQEADEANKAKSIFLANMSHEIRTPLNGILTSIQLLQLVSSDEKQNKYIRMIKESGNSLLGIINDLLDISKIEAGKFKLNEENIELKEIITDAYNYLSLEANQKGLEIRYYLDPNIDFHVIGDKLRLKQILFNLINNAVKFTDVGFVALRVKLLSSDNSCEKLQFFIEDSGIGIEEDFKEKIFKNFNQGDLSASKKYMGTGLGLAISKQLIKLMNGDIHYKSTVGKGSTFNFTCEFKKQIHRSSGKNKYNQDKQQLLKYETANEGVILCVEDSIINQQVMEELITRKGYKYISAYNGIEAINIIKENKVDLVLMDIQLPELNGFEATKIIRKSEESNKPLPIIAMTAYAMLEDRDKCLQAGMDEYISKPLDIEKLYKILEYYIKNK